MSITFNRTTWIRLAGIVLILAFSVFLFFIWKANTRYSSTTRPLP